MRPADGRVGLFPLLLAEGEALYGFVSDDYWLDIGTPAKYLQANHDVLDGLAGLEAARRRARAAASGSARSTEIDPTREASWARASIGENVRGRTRGASSARGRALGDGVEIGEEAHRSSGPSLHDGVAVDDARVVRDSVSAPGRTVGPRDRVTGAVVGAGVTVGADNELARRHPAVAGDRHPRPRDTFTTMKVLVTGGAGFIGSTLVDRCSRTATTSTSSTIFRAASCRTSTTPAGAAEA